MKVLVVDDHKAMREMLRGLLSQIGYADVEEADGVERALAMLAEAHYDLVVSDLGASPGAGIELLRALRAHDRTRETPLVMVAHDAAPDAADRPEQGHSRIVKPFNAATLRAKINHALGGPQR